MYKESFLHNFGTALPLLDIDQVPSKKIVHVQNQVATDEQGRRRFHGAFTGGFSAGYWNTVGSKDGWTPQSFKSSRKEKAPERIQQQPDDFMDDEDRNEYGIAPKGLQVNEDYTAADIFSRKQKRKFYQANLCEPVLQQLIQPVKDKISARILKVWGWRHGQGVGPRKTQHEKKKAREINQKELYLLKHYGCDVLGSTTAKPFDRTNPNCRSDESDEGDEGDEFDSDDDNHLITFAPDDYELPPCISKSNRYGLGYVPLSRASVLGGTKIDTLMDDGKFSSQLHKPLEVLGKNNQKFSFSGHAFGVGALEEDDDEDIYAIDDMTRYDFSAEGSKKPKATIDQKTATSDHLEYDEFILDNKPELLPVYTAEIPFGWQPRNWLHRKSRFEPLPPKIARQLDRTFNSNSSKLTRQQRAELLDEPTNHQSDPSAKSNDNTAANIVKVQPSKPNEETAKLLLDKISLNSSNFTKGGTNCKDEMTANSHTVNEDSCTNSTTFKPFVYDAGKQDRYEKFLAANLTEEEEIQQFLNSIQPIELSPWDRNVEMHEFMQAKRLYRPLSAFMSDRFISESEIKGKETVISKERCEQTDALKVTRTTISWRPHSLLCKRYNIAEPYVEQPDVEKTSKKKSKIKFIDYLDISVNKKSDFQTPIIIPKTLDKIPEAVTQKPQNSEQSKVASEEGVVVEANTELQSESTTSIQNSRKGFQPRTELEKQVVDSVKKPLTEKKDLFKCIFSDSDSTDSETTDTESKDTKPTNQTIASTTLAVNAFNKEEAMNLLRNSSPPRGIFKSLFSTTPQPKQMQANQSNTSQKVDEQIIEETQKKIIFNPKVNRELETATATYGPALPNNLLQRQTLETSPAVTTTTTITTANHFDILSNSVSKTTASVDSVWIEKLPSSQNNCNRTTSSSSDSESSSTSIDQELSLQQKKIKLKSNKNKKKSLERKHKKHKNQKEHKEHKKMKKSKKDDKQSPKKLKKLNKRKTKSK